MIQTKPEEGISHELPPPPRCVQPRKHHGPLWRGLAPVFTAVVMTPLLLIGIGFVAYGLEMVAWTTAGSDVPVRIVHETLARNVKGRPLHEIDYAYTRGGMEHRGKEVLFTNRAYPAVEYPGFRLRVLHVGMIYHEALVLPGQSPATSVPGALVLAGLGVFTIVMVLRGFVILPLRQRQLIKWGRAVNGEILSRDKVQIKTVTWQLVYRFALENGTHVMAKTPTMTKKKARFDRGDTVTVLHFHGRAKPSMIYELSDYQ